MDVHASPASLPELDAFLSTFKVHFRRPEAQAALERYLTGRLTQRPHKNGDTMAQAVPGTHEQRLQGLLTTMQWDEEELSRQRVEKMIAEATIGNGVLYASDRHISSAHTGLTSAFDWPRDPQINPLSRLPL